MVSHLKTSVLLKKGGNDDSFHRSPRDQCAFIDKKIKALAATAKSIAIIATGGYGRGFLCPHSDIDLLFLYSVDTQKIAALESNEILYPMWDSGLKVSHSVRTVSDAVEFSAKDLSFMTSLVDARFIVGDERLMHELKAQFQARFQKGDGATFTEAKIKEMQLRHAKQNYCANILEPNLKDGVGALRDIDTIHWVAKFKYKLKSVQELQTLKVFNADEILKYTQARDFILNLRSALHVVAGRAEEKLALEYLPAVTEIVMGKGASQEASTELMTQYYHHAANVCLLAEVFLNVASRKSSARKGKLSSRTKKISTLDNQLVLSERSIKSNPAKIISLMKDAAETGYSIHPQTILSIWRNRALLTEDICNTTTVRHNFIDILCAENNSADTLRVMSRLGLFKTIMPEFERLRGMMQYDMYHIYTVEEHVINAIETIHDIKAGKLRTPHPLASEVIAKIRSPRALYFAMLLHDIEKGSGGNHAEKGGESAYKICELFGLDKFECESVAWMVQNHLLMTTTVFKRDVYDPITIKSFAEEVKSPEILRELLILTVADIKAVGPNVWNEYKAGLLRALYTQTEALISGVGVSALHSQTVAAYQKTIRDNVQADNLDDYIANLPDSALMYFEPKEHARLHGLLAEHEASKRDISITSRINFNHEITELTIITKDRSGLFADIAGVISLCGGNILGVRAFTLRDGTVVDFFTIQDAQGKAFVRSDKIARISVYLQMALEGKLDIRQKLEAEKRGVFKKSTSINAYVCKIMIDAENTPDTIIEVDAVDKPVLLYNLAETISKHGFGIAGAFISTYGQRIVDVFYLTGKHSKNYKALEKLKSELKQVVG